MGQVFFSDKIQALTRVSNTTLTLGAGSQVRIGGQMYRNTLILTLNTATVGANGIDTGALATNKLYAIWAVASGSALAIVASLSTVLPTGFTAGTIIGYFDTDVAPAIQTVGKDSGHGKLGDLKHSFLTEAQFQAENGPGWILSDTRSITGSRLHSLAGFTTAQDARGRVLRGKNNGASVNPDGDVALGTAQSDQFGTHNHGGGSHGHGGNFLRTNTSSGWQVSGGPNCDFYGTIPSSGTILNTDGGNETRMKNVTVNIFVKVN